jgi:hypothetical protein
MRRLAGLALSLFVLAGCGRSSETRLSSPDARHEIRAVLASYLHALETDDLPLSCSYLSKAGQAKIVAEAKRTAPAATSCEQVMGFTSPSSRRQLQVMAKATTTSDVRVSGDRATILISRAGKTDVSGAVKEAGTWKVSE